jgi:predicted PurR-regulated permease PerM
VGIEILAPVLTFFGVIIAVVGKIIEIQIQTSRNAHKKIKKQDSVEKAIAHIPEIAEKTYMSYDMLNKHINSRQTKLRHDIDDIKKNQSILNEEITNLNTKYNKIDGKIDTLIELSKN